MTHYRYMTTNLITGQVLCDDIPLVVSSFSRTLNTAGELTATLPLQEQFSLNSVYLAALEPMKSLLWVLADGFPVWSGIVWDWPHNSILDGQLPITAQTIESLFDHRLITDTLQYRSIDIFTVFQDLLTYGLSKNSPYISSLSPPALRLPSNITSTMSVAGIQLQTGTAGVPWSASYLYSDLGTINDAWNNLTTTGFFEFTFEPGLTQSGTLAIFVRLGYQKLGRDLPSSGLSFTFPGNVIDYGYQRTGSQSSNYVWATAPPNGSPVSWESLYPHGSDAVALSAGYPLLETTTAWQNSTVTAQSQINSFADGQVQLLTQATTMPIIRVGGSGAPRVQDIVLGDTALFTATSALHPPGPRGVPGVQATVRISSWTLFPPTAQQAEYIEIDASSVVASQTWPQPLP